MRSFWTIAQPWSSRCVETLVQSSIPTRVLMPTASVCVAFTTLRMRRSPAEAVPIPGRSTWKRFWLTLGKRPGSHVCEVPSHDDSGCQEEHVKRRCQSTSSSLAKTGILGTLALMLALLLAAVGMPGPGLSEEEGKLLFK